MRKIYSKIKSRGTATLALTAILAILGIRNAEAQVSAYTFSQSTGTYTAITGGTVLGTTTNDEQVFNNSTTGGTASVTAAGFNIGFNFTYNGVVYGKFAVATNGYIVLGTSATNFAIANSLSTAISSTTAGLNNLISGFNQDLIGQTGSEISYLTQGTAPNRTLTIQWKNYRRYSGSATMNYNFQIILSETVNTVKIVYGTMTTVTSYTSQIGLKGASNTDYSNRSTTTNWSSTTSGTANTATATLSSSVFPASGLTFTWTPPVPCSGTPAGGTATSSVSGICAGRSSTTTLGLTGGATGTGLTYQWQSSPAGTGSWANISGATTVPFTTASISTATDFRLVTTCTNGGATANSTTVTLGVVNCEYNVTRSTGITYSSIMSTGSTYSSLSNADDGFTNIVSLAGTSFKYRGQSVTGFYATSNGTMSFSSTQTSQTSGYGDLTSTTAGRFPVLAPFYTDLVIKGNTSANKDISMRYMVNGTLGSGNADIIVEWAEMEGFGFGPPNMNFQVVLHESGNTIEYNYGNIQKWDGSANNAGSFSTVGAIGLNGSSPGTASFSERMILERMNTAFFGTASVTNLIQAPACNSQLVFTPAATYTGGSAPAASAPSNDNVVGVISLTVNSSPCTSNCGITYSSKNATASTTNVGGGTMVTCSGTEDDDVWFSFVANGPTKITLIPSPSYNLAYQVLDNTGTVVACKNTAAVALTEDTTLSGLTATSTYYVRVWDAGTGSAGSGEFAICISDVVSPPANDDPAGAITLTPSLTCTSTSSILPASLSATATTGVATCSAGTPGTPDDDQWFKFTTPSDSGVRFNIRVVGVSTYNPVVQLFKGTPSTGNSVTCVNASGNGGTETITSNTLSPSTDYYIRVYHSGSGAANGNFSICIIADTPACVTPTSPINMTNVVTTTASLTWTRVVSATSYEIYAGTSNPPATLVATQPGDSATYQYTMPTPNQKYYWKIVPKNSYATSTCTRVDSFGHCPSPPAITLDSGNFSLCTGSTSTNVSVTSTLANYTNYNWTPVAGASNPTGTSVTFNPTSTAVYTLSGVNNSNGCSASVGLTVSVDQLPSAIVLTQGQLKPKCAQAIDSLIASGGKLTYNSLTSFSLVPSSSSFTAISGGTDVNSIEDDDEISGALPIGFSFNYLGTNYTNLYASSNGFISFNASASSTNSNNLNSTTSTNRPLIAALWDDLDGFGGSAKYITTGSTPNRVFTMEWQNYLWNYQATTAGISFQVKLYEGSNNIEFIYQQESGALCSASASIGLTASATGGGNFLSLNGTSAAPTVSSVTETTSINAKPASGQSYLFQLPAQPDITWSPITDLFTDRAASAAYTSGHAAKLYSKPSATTKYYVQAQNGICIVRDSIIDSAKATTDMVSLASASASGASAQCTDGGWTHYGTAADPDKLIFAIQKGAWTNGNETVTIGVNGSPYAISASSQGANQEHQAWLMGRDWDVTVTTQPSSPVLIRFFYDPADTTAVTAARDAAYTTLKTTTNTSTFAVKTPFEWFKTTSVPYDATWRSAIVGNKFPSTHIKLTPTYGTLNGVNYVEFSVASFSGGSGGAGFGPSGGGGGGVGLPVTWAGFDVKTTEVGNELTWKTASEQNTDYFEVQYSYDAQQWSVGSDQLKAAGNSADLRTYNFMHSDFAPFVYYRIKQVDLDGKSDYSAIKLAKRAAGPSFAVNVFPIPLQEDNLLHVSAKGIDKSTVSITMTDITGKVIRHLSYIPSSESIKESFDMSPLTPGLYFIEVQNGQGKETFKVSR